MTREAVLPPVFARYYGKVSYVAQRGANEFSSTCPNCGGTPHDGEWPDRMRWITKGKPRGWCRRCGGIFWPDEATRQGTSTAEMEAWRLERVAAEKRRQEEAAHALAQLRQEKVWLEYVDLMDEAARLWWEKRGIPRDWQSHLQLGFVPQKIYSAGGEKHIAPAHSIPYFHHGFEFVTLQYRLNTNTTDRYRFETGTHAAYYMATPSEPISERVIICEGAVKAMVTHIYGGTGMTVLAVPAKATWGGVVEAVKDAQQVYILLDPDAGLQTNKLAREIGPAARIVSLPVKVDDGFNQYGLTSTFFTAALRCARPG